MGVGIFKEVRRTGSIKNIFNAESAQNIGAATAGGAAAGAIAGATFGLSLAVAGGTLTTPAAAVVAVGGSGVGNVAGGLVDRRFDAREDTVALDAGAVGTDFVGGLVGGGVGLGVAAGISRVAGQEAAELGSAALAAEARQAGLGAANATRASAPLARTAARIATTKENASFVTGSLTPNAINAVVEALNKKEKEE